MDSTILAFLHEKDFKNFDTIAPVIQSLLKYSEKDSRGITNKAVCYRCHKYDNDLYLHQPPTLSKLSDEIIYTHPLCNVCLKKTTATQTSSHQ